MRPRCGRRGSLHSARSLSVVLAVCLLALSGACKGVGNSEIATTPGRSLPTPTAVIDVPGVLLGFVWPGDDVFVVTWQKDPLQTGTRVGLLGMKGGMPDLVDIPGGPRGCTRLDYGGLSLLEGGRVGMPRWCYRGPPPVEVDLLWFDPRTRDTAPLIYRGSLGSLDSSGGFVFAADPAGGQAVIGAGNLICDGLVLVDEDGPADFGGKVVGPGGEFSPGHFPGVSDCTSTGNAFSPTWSRDGGQVAFFASTESIGVDGMARLDQPASLVLTRPGTWEMKPILEGIDDGGDIAFAPDGQSLAFSGTLDRSEGVWLLDLATEKPALISEGVGTVGSLAFSPDGQQLAVQKRDEDQAEGSSRIEFYAVP